jgi:hypothetical protein
MKRIERRSAERRGSRIEDRKQAAIVLKPAARG